MLKKTGIILCALLLAAGFAAGVAQLFELRFDRGDIYPPYSTLRTDPLGTSALYESLNRVPGLSARRYFEPTFKENSGHDRTLMVLGLDTFGNDGLPRAEFATLQQFVYDGGRVVMAYSADVSEISTNREETPFLGANKKNEAPKAKTSPEKKPGAAPKTDKAAEDKKKADDKSPKDETDDDWRGMTEYASPESEWGFHLDRKNLATNDDGTVQFPIARCENPATGLPADLVIHTALYFEQLTNGWATVYQRDDLPVMVERRLGKGSVLLVADAYYFSNEAMLKDRQTGLLAWAIGGGRETIFDEAHLGVWLDPGVASLMRKYHLHGLVFSLLLLAGLFIWKNASSLVPPHDTAESAAPVAGKDAMAGFVNLLRRGIPRASVLDRIFEEWQKTGRRSTINPELRREIENLMQQENAKPTGQRQPLTVYRTISTLLHRRH